MTTVRDVVAPEHHAAARLAVMREEPSSPWYVRGLVGVGAWIGSVLIAIAFLMALDLQSELVLGILGVVLAGAAIFFSRVRGTVALQLVFICSLAGQIAVTVSLGHFNSETSVLGTLSVVNLVLMIAVRTELHRFLCTLVLVGSLCLLLANNSVHQGVEIIALACVVTACTAMLLEPHAITLGWFNAARPSVYALTIAALAILVVSTIATLAHDGVEEWLGVGAILGWSGPFIVAGAAHRIFRARSAWTLVVFALAVAAVTLPSISVTLAILATALVTRRLALVTLATLCLAFFVGALMYMLDTPLLTKAILLAAVGGALVVGRVVLAWVMPDGKRPSTALVGEWRRALFVGGALVITLGSVMALATGKEMTLRRGAVVYLPLVPVDPRSLMQGDYMRLDTEVSRSIEENTQENVAGRVVVALDHRSVATFVRIDRGEPLAPHERRIKFKLRDMQARVGAEAFFFAEGRAPQFEAARFAVMRVDGAGGSVLVGLADKDLMALR